MDDKWFVILIVFMVLLMLITFTGCGLDLAGDALAHNECLRQGVPTDSQYTYMRGLHSIDAVCVIKVEVPIQLEE